MEIVVVGIVGLILVLAIFRFGLLLKDVIAPTPPPGPTVAFGKLPMVNFPEATNTSTYTYAINTLSGSLPKLPDQINVYQLEQPSPNLLGLDKAKAIAQSADFTTDPTQLSETVYQWQKTDPMPQTLTMDIQSFDFTFSSQYQTDATVLSATHMPNETLAQTVSKAFFDKIEPLPTSIDESKTKATLFAITPGGLIPASSLSTAQIVRVDYFPQAVDTFPIYAANPTQSLLYALVASGPTNYPQVLEVQYLHKSPTSTKATYPIITAQAAFDELKQGKGYVAANPTGDTNITITDVTLGYFVTPTPQKYLWPIIVFVGDKGFYAYVAAIPPAWIQK